MGLKRFALVLGVVLVACSTAGFEYNWYGLHLDSPEDYDKGMLLGPSEEDDLPLSVCKPDDIQTGKCVVYLIAEHEKLKRDYIELEERLKACEESL